MSFTRLLAASRSLMGIKKQPGPYKLNQEHLLPKFSPVQRPLAAALEEPAVAPDGLGAGTDREVRGKTRGRLASWAARWIRFGRRRPPAVAAKRAVQTELALSGVRVVRNDLSDCNFRVVLGNDLARGAKQSRSGSQRQALGMVWNRLSARLLRQAAQEFTLVQKERGKLCSQAGDGGAGPGGA